MELTQGHQVGKEVEFALIPNLPPCHPLRSGIAKLPSPSLLVFKRGLVQVVSLPSWENSLASRLPPREPCLYWLTSGYRPGLSVGVQSIHGRRWWPSLGAGVGDRQLQEFSSSFCSSSVLGMKNDRVLSPPRFSVCCFMSCLWGSSTQGSSHRREEVTDGPWTSLSWS